ncbi:Bicarbonate transport ATP-binding protein CmpD [Pigmentiphaga humi]|uniref:Bicarbonate transport ATP-binding protein CmpD n=1 Tax=Pigmentiphaga humi TaxID=2478468 RepID=A0A3P4B0J0_9BURK|nr:ABC transporter ATP-binding protein [Pigmentiphaga humi]VCU69361.1 Bicarbonate transport ATP-binding protein CmpD [Pigmentiphaga humi]
MHIDHIHIDNVRKTFLIKNHADGQPSHSELEVLAGIDLAVREGEFLTVVGPSGSGKSVLLDIISGLASASSGSVRVGGELIAKPSRDVSYVFQQYALFPWKTALQNIEYPLQIRGVPGRERSARAWELLELFGLKDFAHRYPSQLSGGMQQRVAIARALVPRPKVLLMDEPFAALDAQTREALQIELLRIWNALKTTVIFITHGLDEAVFLGDRVAVMAARPGRIKRILDIDLPRPRDADLRASNTFNLYRQRVWEVLRDEVIDPSPGQAPATPVSSSSKIAA